MHRNARRIAQPRFEMKPLAVALLLSLGTQIAHALPQGGTIAAGTANIATAGTGMTVTQTTNSATYNWQSFNIGKTESVHFQQPGATSVALNYVLGNTNSLIEGKLSSNGQLFLSNPNGILFGATAQVNVAGLKLEAGNANVDNAGRINVKGGNLTAHAGIINNTGIIEASSATRVGGKIVLTSTGAISNTGSVLANGTAGGSVLLNAGTSILQQGTIGANGASLAGGAINLTAVNRIIQNSSAITQADGTTNGGAISYRTNTAKTDGGLLLSGSIRANGGSGGRVILTGPNVELLAAKINAAGTANGGTINIGGGFQGKDASIVNAQKTSVNAATTINASATLGNGGSVVVWSNQQTSYLGTINATGGALATKGGQVEVSGKNLGFNGMVTTATANGLNGSLMLDPVNLVIQSSNGARPQVALGRNGSLIELANGNFVVWNPTDATAASAAGAVWLFDGVSGALISTLTGSAAGDMVGGDGVTALSNGNFVVSSSSWDNGTVHAAGAVTWVNGASGLSGMVSSSNSLVGNVTRDLVGFGGITPLANGNYVVSSYPWHNNRGAVTWGNGQGGTVGIVSSANSLVGSVSDNVLQNITGDQVGWGGVKVLLNGNYLVQSPYWNSSKGAATWGSSTTGVKGVISATNSLVGSTPGDFVGGGTITGVEDILEVGSDHYLVLSPGWGGNRGAVTWGNSVTGIRGVVSSTNSLVGSTSGALGVGDSIGYFGVTLLANDGNYLVESPWWNRGRGAVTWGNGMTGITGVVSSANSLVGGAAGDLVGSGGITLLGNGNYIVGSPYWGGGKGAVTWGSGATGISGVVSGANSLVGSVGGDYIGYGQAIGYVGGQGMITVLSNGNYVVGSPNWGGGMGAATWGNGMTGMTGVVSATNSLVGSASTDHVSSTGIFALTNGNYLVGSSDWNAKAGAVTWGDGSTGLVGTVSSANSLTGGTAGDGVGFARALSNGNYVVSSAFGGKGAVTWGNGATGTTGIVSASNSLVGSVAGDSIGSNGIYLVGNGNYVVSSGNWSGGRGAVTWVNGTTGLVGTVSAANSLVGSTLGDHIGGWAGGSLMATSGVEVLSNGSYVVKSYYWNGNRGAVTWGGGNSGVSGVVSAANSLVGSVAGDYVGGYGLFQLSGGDYLVVSSAWNNWAGAVTRGSGTAGVSGVISATNSLVGEIGGGFFVGDALGFGGGVRELTNGNYIVGSRRGWAWSDRSTGPIGSWSSNIHVPGGYVSSLSNGRFVMLVGNSLTNRSLVIFDGGISNSTFLTTLPSNWVTYATGMAPNEVIDPRAITAITNNGTAVTLQASNDIRINSSIITTPNAGVLKGGNLTLAAGRNLVINADINTAGGNLTLIANDRVANGVVATDRSPGSAAITQGAISVVNTGAGLLTMDLRNGGAASGIYLNGNISARKVILNSAGIISQNTTGGITTGLLTSNAVGGTELVGVNNISNLVSNDTGLVHLTNAAINLGLGNISAAGLHIRNQGAIGQLTGTNISIRGTTTLVAHNNTNYLGYRITLANASNNFAGAVSLDGAYINLLDSAGGLVLGNVNATGALVVASKGGAITQAAATRILVLGATNLTANNGVVGAGNVRYSISLANATNNFVGAVAASGLNINLLDSSCGLVLGDISATGALAVASKDGNISQAPLTRTVVSGATTLIAGGVIGMTAFRYGITLTNTGNDFMGKVTANGTAITLRDANALNAVLTGTGPATLIAAGPLLVSGTLAGALSNLATTTMGATGTTTFGALTVGGRLAVTSSGSVKRTLPATPIKVAGLLTTSTTVNAKVTVNGVVGKLIP